MRFRVRTTLVVLSLVCVSFASATSGVHAQEAELNPVEDLVNGLLQVVCDPDAGAPSVTTVGAQRVIRAVGRVTCSHETIVTGSTCIEVGIDPELGGPVVECTTLAPSPSNPKNWRSEVIIPCLPGPWITAVRGTYASGSGEIFFNSHSSITNVAVSDCVILEP